MERLVKVCRLSSKQQGWPTGKDSADGRWEVGGDTTLKKQEE
jgi:hypothetical protein